MRGQRLVPSRRLVSTVVAGALLLASTGAAASANEVQPSELPACTEISRAAGDDGVVVDAWQAILDEEGAVTGHRLTLRHDGAERRLRTGRRGFAVRSTDDRLLIGERAEGATRLDMVDTSRACRLWTRRLQRLLYPESDAALGSVRLTVHDRDTRRYEGTQVLDADTGATEAMVEDQCIESCLPNDGGIGLAALEVAGASRPTPNFTAGGWPKDKTLNFRWKAGAAPPTWAKTPLKSGAADASGTSGSRSPRFGYNGGSSNALAYTGSFPAFCSSTGIACAKRSMPSYWGVWLRPYGTEYAWGTLRWCQKTSSASGCFDIRRVMLHEVGHITGLNHPSSNGFTLNLSDSVMQGITPARPKSGSSRHAFGRCDVATLQELYDTTDNKTDVSTCNDVVTKLTLSTNKSSLARGASVKLTAQLRVDSRSAYRQLSNNPLNGRSLKLKYRRAGSNDAWKTAWMRSIYSQGRYELTIAPAATWEFKAVFPKPLDEGLRYSRSGVKKVKVTG